MLRQKPQLEVNLQNNKATRVGAKHLIQAAVASGKKTVDLTNFNLTDLDVRHLEEDLQHKIEELIITGNKFTTRGEEKLAKIKGLKIVNIKEPVSYVKQAYDFFNILFSCCGRRK